MDGDDRGRSEDKRVPEGPSQRWCRCCTACFEGLVGVVPKALGLSPVGAMQSLAMTRPSLRYCNGGVVVFL